MAKLLLLLLTFVVTGGDVIFKPEGEEGIPRGCTGKACMYRVEWEYLFDISGEYGRFTVMARQKNDTYIAFGFSSEKNSKKILAVYGYKKKSGKNVIVKGKILHGNTKPKISGSDRLDNMELTYEDGVFTLSFDLYMNTTDEDNVNLMNPYYYVLMVGGGPVLNDNELGLLEKNALQYTDKQISLIEEVTTLPHHPMETQTPPSNGDVIFEPEGEEGIPHGCTGNSCVYRVQWEFIAVRLYQYARFTVMARQENDTYVAFGFSSEKNTNKILAVYGYMTKSGENVVVKGTILSGNTIPQLSDNRDGTDIAYSYLTYEDGVFTLVFHMSMEKTGEDDVNLMNPYYYVLMVGGGPVVNDTELGPLGENTLQYTDKQISIVVEASTIHDL